MPSPPDSRFPKGMTHITVQVVTQSTGENLLF